MIRVAIIGVTGRMGRCVVRAAVGFPDLRITAAVASGTSASLGLDCGELAGIGSAGVKITADLPRALAAADVAIDFSAAAATACNLAACRAAGKAMVIGTTGFGPDLAAAFESAARDIPLLVAPNTSLGVTVLMELVGAAARALPGEFDIEITEAHHRHKRDAPSGTALALAEAAASARHQPFDRHADAKPNQARAPGEIGFAVTRAGDLVGEHAVLFAGTGECLTLSHRATDRTVFARGALQAAAWLASRPAGRYFMRDLVSYKSGA